MGCAPFPPNHNSFSCGVPSGKLPVDQLTRLRARRCIAAAHLTEFGLCKAANERPARDLCGGISKQGASLAAALWAFRRKFQRPLRYHLMIPPALSIRLVRVLHG